MKKILIILALLPVLVIGQNNLLDTSSWTVGSGNVAGFNTYGLVHESERLLGTDGHGNSSVLWMSKPSGDGSADGGYYSHFHNIDPSKTYRFSVWLKKTNSTSGSTYFGLNTRNASGQWTTLTLAGTSNTNPYFWYGDLPQLDRWYLLVGYVHPNSYSGTSQGVIYDGVSGTEVTSINLADYKFSANSSELRLRSITFGATNSSDRQYSWDPTIYEVNGLEPTISELLGQGSGNIDVTSVSLNTSNISLAPGETTNLSATVLPNDATDPSLNWASSNTAIATVNSSGLVTAIAEGSANITATSNSNTSISDSATATVSSGGSSGGGIWTQDGSNIHFTGGQVGIGTSGPDEALTVKGKIHAEEVRVDLSVPGPDYVFKEDYPLMPLNEIREFIEAHGHLPNIPSAKEMEINGVELGAMEMKLLEKIEELTLYILLLKEENEKILVLEKRLQSIENQLSKIKK